MLDTIIGTKDKMDQTFSSTGEKVPVTVVQAGPCVVTQIKTQEKDGYWAVQVGYGNKKLKHTTKQLQGHLKDIIKDEKAPRFIKEIRTTEEQEIKVGDTLSIADIFAVGDTVKVTGTSKGKGFAGGVKRHGFKGGPRTHGQSDRLRAPGSIGQGTDPGRIWKGKRMAGRMGSDTVTINNLKIVSVDTAQNTISISGAIPGSKGTLITIKRTSPKQEITNNDTEKGDESNG